MSICKKPSPRSTPRLSICVCRYFLGRCSARPRQPSRCKLHTLLDLRGNIPTFIHIARFWEAVGAIAVGLQQIMEFDSRTVESVSQILCLTKGLWLANCQFAHDSSGFPVLLRFCDAQSCCSFHPFHRHAGPVARSWRRPFPSCGVASPQTPTLAPESLPATIPPIFARGTVFLPAGWHS